MDWKVVTRPTRRCSQCQQRFQKGEICYLALKEQDGNWEKWSFCTPCWRESKEEMRRQFFCFWKKCMDSSTTSTTALSPAEMYSLFCSLMEKGDLQSRKFAYLLSLVLVQKRFLRWQGVVRKEGKEILQLYCRQEDQLWEIAIPQIEADEEKEIQRQLAKIWEGEDGSLSA